MTGARSRFASIRAWPTSPPSTRRGYRTVDVRSGYGEWAATYEDTVEDAMDVELLEALREVAVGARRRPPSTSAAAPGAPAPGSRRAGSEPIDGVDITPEMLERARARGVYRRLVEADVTSTGLPAGGYDLLVTSLVDEHLADLEPLYAEAARLAAPGRHLRPRGPPPPLPHELGDAHPLRRRAPASRSRSRPTCTC